MIEVGDRAGFRQVGFGIFGSIHQIAMRHLDGHRAAQLVVLGQIDQAEPALAQHSFDPVATNAFREPCQGYVGRSGRTVSKRRVHGRIMVRRRFKRIALSHARWWSSRCTASSSHAGISRGHCTRAVSENHQGESEQDN